MSYPRLPFLLLPLTRREFPAWGRLFRLFRISVPPGSTLWEDAPKRVIRGKSHGFLMELQLHDWAERMTYFLGRYYELPQQILLESVLEPGDRMVDVGGNIGMITLIAAKMVGPSGMVQTFEPNPMCLARLRGVLEMNRIDWVTVYPFGLSDRRGDLELTIVHGHSGVGTFAPTPTEHESAVTSRLTLEVRRGDDVLLELPKPIKLIKIDVEGFETKALSGMQRTLARDWPHVVLETIDKQLKQAGSSAGELFQLMQGSGYRAYAMRLRRKGLRYSLGLQPVADPSEIRDANDTFWVHPEGPPVDGVLQRFWAG